MTSHAVGLRIDHARAGLVGTDANFCAQVNDLFRGHSELFGER
jgi:hypothetical protein